MAFIEDTNHYIVQKEIGKGAFGKALLVRSIANMNEFYVVKVIDVVKSLEKVGDKGSMARKIISQLYNEASQLKMTFVHDNIVQMYSSFEDKQRHILYIVLEYCPCGTLLQVIHEQLRDKHRTFSENRIQCWTRQLISALKLLHKSNVIHRDIKSENIFVADNHKTLKIGDFGFAKKLNVFDQLATTYAGTRCYMAPEISQNQPYTLKVDIWSLGVVVYEMAALKLPFNNDGKGIPPLPACFTKMLYDLIVNRMLVADPHQRASIEELANHDWFKVAFPKSSIVSSSG